MDKEALKALGLTDEQVAKIHEDYGKNYVTKAQFNERLDELKHEKEEREKTAKALDDLKKQHESDADFQKQIADLQKAAKDREAEYTKQVEQMKLDSAIDKALTGAKVRNTKAARALLDMADAKLNDKGEVEGLSAKIEALKKSDGYLFGDTNASGFKPHAARASDYKNAAQRTAKAHTARRTAQSAGFSLL